MILLLVKGKLLMIDGKVLEKVVKEEEAVETSDSSQEEEETA